MDTNTGLENFALNQKGVSSSAKASTSTLRAVTDLYIPTTNHLRHMYVKSEEGLITKAIMRQKNISQNT